MSTLKDYYNSTVAPAMMKKFNYENVMHHDGRRGLCESAMPWLASYV